MLVFLRLHQHWGCTNWRFICNMAAENGVLPNKRQKQTMSNTVTVVLGSQWGDEGKGKIVDLLATEADVVCRCQVCLPKFFVL